MTYPKYALPTEPIGSIPRPQELIRLIDDFSKHKIPEKVLEAGFNKAVRETLKLFEETDSPVITDGEQRKPSFATYPVHTLKNVNANGISIPFKDGHTRTLPLLTSGPFQYATFASEYLKKAKALTQRPLKQAVISPSALSLLYPSNGLKDYSPTDFINDLIKNAVRDIRECLEEGALVQIDFTEARLAVKLDPSKTLLKKFLDLNNQVLGYFTKSEKARMGVHTCPGGDQDSTHSADVPYSNFLPEFFQLEVGNFYLQWSSEKDREGVLKILKPLASENRRIFLGVTDPISSRVETPKEIENLILTASKFIAPENLGTTDDCGFSPFCDDISTSRDTAFSKIKNRVLGTVLASEVLNTQRAHRKAAA